MSTIHILKSKTFDSIVGAYTDLIIATSIAKTNNCEVISVEVNAVYPGYLDSVKQLWGESAAADVLKATHVSDKVVKK